MIIYFSRDYLNSLNAPPSTAPYPIPNPEMDEAALALTELARQLISQRPSPTAPPLTERAIQPTSATTPEPLNRAIFTPQVIRYIQEHRLFLELQKDVVRAIQPLVGREVRIPEFSSAFSALNHRLPISWPGRAFKEGRLTASEALNHFRQKTNPDSARVLNTTRAARRGVPPHGVSREVERLERFAVRYN